MWLLILAGAVVGWLLGGLGGLAVGGLLGFFAGRVLLEWALAIGRSGLQEQFLDTTFAVMGAVCKADGRVSREEIRLAERYFDLLALSSEQRQAARESFTRGKCVGFDLYGEVRALINPAGM